MILHKGDLWHYPADLYFVTTNSYITKNKELVMGRGAALQAKNKYPELPKVAATTIQHLGYYGLRIFPQWKIGLFQVKYNWSNPAQLRLIRNSANDLFDFAQWFYGIIVLNFPGIGNGQLNRADVLPLIEILPDNVIVCEQ